MKQVLFIGMSPNQGGIETFMMNIFMRLEGNGFHFTFINTSSKKLAYSDTILRDGGTIKHVLMNTSLWTHSYYFRYKAAYSFLKNHHNYDIIHLNAVTINVIFWLRAAEHFNISKLIIHSHNNGILYNSNIKKFIADIIAQFNIKYLNTRNNITELAVNNESGKWMFHNDKFAVINNGVDTDKFKFNINNKLFIRKRLKISLKDKVIITIARLVPQKNYIKILNVFFYIHKLESNTRLVIVGNGPEMNLLVKYSKKLNIYNSIRFLGMINDVNKVLSIADLMLMPSRYEGFPFSLLESQSVGVPALVSKKAIPYSSNVTNTLFFLSLSKSNEFWAYVACRMLLHSPDTRKKYNMNNKIKKSKYNINSSINQIKKIYLG